MKIAIITADDRTQFGLTHEARPRFGTAPAGLIEGLSTMSEIELHIVSCSPIQLKSPEKLGQNVWYHQAVVSKLGWGKSLFIGCTRATNRILKDISPDIVHGQGTERNCAIGAVYSGYPSIITIHGNMRVHSKRMDNGNYAYYKLAAILEKHCLKKADGVISISNYTHSLIKQFSNNIWSIPNAVGMQFFEANPTPPSTPRVLFVGSLNERKNPIGLVDACRDLLASKQCTLAIAGQSKPSQYLHKLQKVASQTPGVYLLGHLDRKELANEIANSSLLVLPSFEDNCPMVILEAMASGVPVAASNVGGIPEIIQHNVNGLVFDPSDPSQIRASVESMISNPELRAKFSINGRELAERVYHPRKIAEQHLEIYKTILNNYSRLK